MKKSDGFIRIGELTRKFELSNGIIKRWLSSNEYLGESEKGNPCVPEELKYKLRILNGSIYISKELAAEIGKSFGIEVEVTPKKKVIL